MKLQLKRSLRLSNGAAQAPSAEQMSYGEIAVNYSDTDPSIFLKDSTNVVRKLAISSLPDTSSSSAQSGTLDDRYLMLSGGTVSGDVSATNFLGGVARVATSAPASGSESELWFNSSTGRLYIRYSGQWVDASPDSFTMGTDFYSKTQADSAISTAVTALENGQVATNTSAIASLTTDISNEESARLAAEADKMDVAGGTFTGPVSFNEDVIVKGGAGGSGEITLNCELNSHGVKLKGPAHSANASYTLTLPPSAGNSGEVLTTDGNGGLTWEESTSSPSALPALPSEMESTDLLLIERGGVQYKIPSSDLVPVTGAIHTPVEVLTPLNGAGVGGDRSYTPMSNTISAVSQPMVSSELRGYYDYVSTMRGLAYANGYYIAIENGYRYQDMYDSMKYWDTNYYGTDNFVVSSTSVRRQYSSQWNQINSIAYGLGVWVAFGRQDGTNGMYFFWHEDTNPTSAEWKTKNDSGASFPTVRSSSSTYVGTYDAEWKDVHFANNKFILVGEYSENLDTDLGTTLQQHLVYYSNNGKVWNYCTTPAGRWSAVTYGNGKWVVVGNTNSSNKIIYSTDGISWSSASAPHSGYGDVDYGDGRFVAVGNFSGSDNTNSCFATSTDGVSWTNVSAIPGRWDHIVYGNGRWVAMNDNAGIYGYSIAYSDDGLNWSVAPGLTFPASAPSNAGNSANPMALLYANGRFVATIQGYMYVSEDANFETSMTFTIMLFIYNERMD